MANVKEDLLQQLATEKYYAEIELVRLANDPNMNYNTKITQLSNIISQIALINLKGELTGQYFQEAPQGEPEGQPEQPEQPVDAPDEQPVDNVVESQPQSSHSE